MEHHGAGQRTGQRPRHSPCGSGRDGCWLVGATGVRPLSGRRTHSLADTPGMPGARAFARGAGRPSSGSGLLGRPGSGRTLHRSGNRARCAPGHRGEGVGAASPSRSARLGVGWQPTPCRLDRHGIRRTPAFPAPIKRAYHWKERDSRAEVPVQSVRYVHSRRQAHSRHGHGCVRLPTSGLGQGVAVRVRRPGAGRPRRLRRCRVRLGGRKTDGHRSVVREGRVALR